MFKKTRRKIVAAIMSILVFLFIGMLAVIYLSSYYDTLSQNQQMLKDHAALYFLEDAAGNPDAAGAPDTASSPDSAGAPDTASSPDSAGAPDAAGSPDSAGAPDAAGSPDSAGAPNAAAAANIENNPQYQLSSFYSVAISRDGSILKTDNTKNVYTDEELEQTALQIYEGKKESGTAGNLIYYKADKGNYTLIAFMDNSLTLQSFSTLFQYALVCGGITILLLFFLARALAGKIVRPLEESYTKQKQFISDAGHELKTPIAVVSTNAELLAREIGSSPWLANIQYENERMASLVTQLLDLTRTESAKLPMKSIDFSRLIKGETLPFESVIFEKGMSLALDIEDEIKVYGNPVQLKQMISILLDNAVQHSDLKGEIRIRLKGERSHAVLSVVNHGKEISADQQKQLFERFYRIDAARTGDDKHYGLGLAIAKAIVTTHKGKIGVSCHDGVIEFTVRLPLLTARHQN